MYSNTDQIFIYKFENKANLIDNNDCLYNFVLLNSTCSKTDNYIIDSDILNDVQNNSVIVRVFTR